MCADISYFFVPVGLYWVNLVDRMSSQLDKSPLDSKSECLAGIFLCMSASGVGLLRQAAMLLLLYQVGEFDQHNFDELKNTHLYVICLCCHFCPVRAYRRFLTLNLAAPPIWSGTPHLGFFIHLDGKQEMPPINTEVQY